MRKERKSFSLHYELINIDPQHAKEVIAIIGYAYPFELATY